MSTRRDILAAGLLFPGLVQARPRRRRHRPLLPRVNGGMNVQPLRRMDAVSDFTPPLIVPELVLLQMRAIYELGFRSIRITLSFNDFGPDFFAAIPYVRLARSLGIHVLAIVDQFGSGFDLLRALADPLRRRRVLEAYHAIFSRTVRRASPRVHEYGQLAFQLLNEPTEARSLEPADYVVRFLGPAYADLKAIDSGTEVVAAAPVGRRAGIWRLQQMLLAGLERTCDRVALHVYDRALIPELAGLVRAPVAVTETAARRTAGHLPWVQEIYPELRETLPTLGEIYWFHLFDFEPGALRILDIREDEHGVVTASEESTELASWWRARTLAAAGDRPRATFGELVPDLDRYLPTGEDFAIAEAARLSM